MKNILFLIALIISITTYSSCNAQNKNADNIQASDSVARVYFTKDISPQSLIKMYQVLGSPAKGKVGIKIHMGEPGGNNYLKPWLVKDLVQMVNGTFIDACTAYGGRRTTPTDYMKVAEEHGFTKVAPVDILDEDGDTALPIVGGRHLKEVWVGSHFLNYDYIIVLTHFKGHSMGGFGGSLKNIAIGIASVRGKCLVHSAGASSTNAFLPGTKQEDFIESMAESAQGMTEAFKGRILYINVMTNLSVDCDCSSHPAAPTMKDIGILASFDPVALDRACVDLIYASQDPGKKELIERIESRKGTLILSHAEQLGVGTQQYQLINLDK
jgi:uncharacterized Fe-S center protein